MRVTTFGDTENEEKQRGPGAAHLTMIDVSYEEADRGWGGQHIATVNIMQPDGKQARFFVSVHIDMNGKAWGEIAANRKNDNVRRKCCAPFLDYEARRAEALSK